MSQAPPAHGSIVSRDSVTLPPSAGNTVSMLLLILGGLGVLATIGAAFGAGEATPLLARKAMASYHVGALTGLSMMLGSMAFVMILHQVNAGWASSVRRQAENVMSLIWPWGALLMAPTIVISIVHAMSGAEHPLLFKWMNSEYVAGDVLYEHKRSFLNIPFWTVRAVVYFLIWSWLARGLYRMSLEQDRTGDKWLSARMRRRSSYGLLLFAFSTAFASFDWMMGLDFHWFSTMFGVYFFAQNMGACLSVVILIMLALRRAGRLQHLGTNDHLHDMGKLLFAFVVFWGYIAFSQYFLIWYGNIPEETAWYVRRRTNGWEMYSFLEAAGRFLVPFVVLLPRPARRSPFWLALMCVWILVFHMLDLFYVVRPEVYGPDKIPPLLGLLDFVAAAAPVLIVFGVLIRRVRANPLVPLNDPRLEEAAHHKNYV